MIQHERESAMIRQCTMANEPQRSAGVKCSCNLSQGKPCQIPWTTPLVLYSIVLSLTLSKLHLASFSKYWIGHLSCQFSYNKIYCILTLVFSELGCKTCLPCPAGEEADAMGSQNCTLCLKGIWLYVFSLFSLLLKVLCGRGGGGELPYKKFRDAHCLSYVGM